VEPKEFTYPSYEIPLVEAYGCLFESAFIVLHPFVRIPASLAWTNTRQYPSDDQIIERGEKFPWAEVAARTGLTCCAQLCQALLTSIGSLPDHLADLSAAAALRRFLESQTVWMPAEGRFEPLLRADFLRAFELAGAPELLFVPEFTHTNPTMRLPLAGFHGGSIPFPPRGTLLALDRSFLFTVDWDSFFTLFYGTR